MKVQDLKKKLPNCGTSQQIELLKDAAEEFDSIGDQGSLAHTNLILGNVYTATGQNGKAVSCFGSSSETFGRLGDLYGEAAALNNLAFANKNCGDTSTALNNYEKALSIYRRLSDKEHEHPTLLNIAKLYYSLGEYLEAIEYFEDALEISDKPTDTDTLFYMGSAYSRVNDHARALEYLEKSLMSANESGDKEFAASIVRAMTGTYLGMGEDEKAGQIVTEYAAILKQNKESSIKTEAAEFNFPDLVTTALNECSGQISSSNLRAIFKASGDNIIVKSNRKILLQILNTLISNAVSATPPGKNIYAYVSKDEVADGAGDGAKARCEIIDEGSGFVNMQTAELSEAKSLAGSLGGELRSESMLSKGSAFVLELPAV